MLNEIIYVKKSVPSTYIFNFKLMNIGKFTWGTPISRRPVVNLSLDNVKTSTSVNLTF